MTKKKPFFLKLILVEFGVFLLDNKSRFESKKKMLYGKLTVFFEWYYFFFVKNKIPLIIHLKKKDIRKKKDITKILSKTAQIWARMMLSMGVPSIIFVIFYEISTIYDLSSAFWDRVFWKKKNDMIRS